MDATTLGSCPIYFGDVGYTSLNKYLKERDVSKVVVLVDENTRRYCLPYFSKKVDAVVPVETIEIESGEFNKTIDTCVGIWKTLSERHVDKKSLLVNLGGGVITDMGGFAACCFKRGITYVNVPTTLLCMVDASVGGKTGVDLEGLKNVLGVIKTPEMVLIDSSFLKTLPQNQIRSGMAEMLKHALISGSSHWERIKALPKIDLKALEGLISESVAIKERIVARDPLESHLRKVLNFGHTLGHAIESYFLNYPYHSPLLHGEAVAVGMILECYLSVERLGFPLQIATEIKRCLTEYYGKIAIYPSEYRSIIELLKYDKKNYCGNINFVLLAAIGDPQIDCLVDNNAIVNAFAFYASQ